MCNRPTYLCLGHTTVCTYIHTNRDIESRTVPIPTVLMYSRILYETDRQHSSNLYTFHRIVARFTPLIEC
ncbi:hypothetical protein HOLleu_41277 [Holothuria leucospilota]|uniref:Uncharacterized protein n=1 Tax=Holothuria leucospilota TaxID=206669 RepID=A0A9Q0YIY7_HOLLE|nr:hypothetical protein HOLleu_41277 [Holothuria leucospilota]